ncbi:MAG: pre-peptidase C-terminal domain-containing protein [Xenococcaceae cyanobacterium MO_207.B15]|nr:pre-peptidase C-terminal domain-containing protein [Xenococcaceae cyanobacterium MO_207.B15]
MATFNYDLGSLNSTPTQDGSYLRAGWSDVYEFDISGTRNINLSLNNISAGDDADLSLYRDSNGNGILDSGDLRVGSSAFGGNSDDSINYRASSGTYFARVDYYSGGSDGRLDYDLDLSATYTWQATNTVAVESDLGNFSGDVYRSGWVGNTDTTDTYEFDLGLFEGVNIRLYGLNNDADIRLIQDRNNNGIVESNEIIETSALGSNSSESISGIDLSGTYQLQVYQYSGDTSYQISFDHYTTDFA